MGVDYRKLIHSAKKFYEQSCLEKNLASNPGIYLGSVLGYFAGQGKDKLSFILSNSVSSFGSWLEQLIAESTGKEKKGILPVDGEVFESLEELSGDRIYLAVGLQKESDPKYQARIKMIQKAGFPLIQITWPNSEVLGSEFLRWEVATAISCIPLNVNPFDEPNVTESKEITGKILRELEKTGKIQRPNRVQKATDIEEFLSSIKKGQYLALLSYTERTPELTKRFAKIRQTIRKRYRIPVLLGFGPRYLHSIGQYYKGGSPKGNFVEFLKKDSDALKVPGSNYSFGQLKLAQAIGDYQAIKNKGLPILLVDLGKDANQGLLSFEKLIA